MNDMTDGQHATHRAETRPDKEALRTKWTVPCCLQMGGFLQILSLTIGSEDGNRAEERKWKKPTWAGQRKKEKMEKKKHELAVIAG